MSAGCLVHAVEAIADEPVAKGKHEALKAQRDALLLELELAHKIIRNALNLMMSDQKRDLGTLNYRDGCDGEGVTRANEREALIALVRESM